ncbi:type II secretion system minor pseudopilin GspK [Azotobacter sp. CWF10]
MKGSAMAARQHGRGMALMIVLLVVALISIIATHLGSLVQLNIRQAANREQYQQAYWFALGGERVARKLLESALKTDKRTHPRQAWADPRLSYPIDGGVIRIRIQDQNACFNLNALSTLNTPQDASQTKEPLLLRQFARLLEELGADESQTAQLVEPLRDWLDNDTLPTGVKGAEDLFYTGLEPAYLPANGPLADPTELYLIDGFRQLAAKARDDEQSFLHRLRPYLCALPDTKLQVNVNSLGPEQAPLLSALFEGQVPLGLLTQWLSERPAEGFGNVDEFWALLRQSGDDTLSSDVDAAVKTQLRVSSEFFLARIEVDYHDANLVLLSRIQIRNGTSAVYQRHYGALDE